MILRIFRLCSPGNVHQQIVPESSKDKYALDGDRLKSYAHDHDGHDDQSLSWESFIPDLLNFCGGLQVNLVVNMVPDSAEKFPLAFYANVHPSSQTTPAWNFLHSCICENRAGIMAPHEVAMVLKLIEASTKFIEWCRDIEEGLHTTSILPPNFAVSLRSCLALIVSSPYRRDSGVIAI